MSFVRLLTGQANKVTLHIHKLSHHAPVKIPKSKYNLQFFNLKLIAEDVIRYFSNKSAFHDELKVSFPAGGLFNLHALF